MGVSLPELPSAHSDDNINLGDKDSIRRRALWALEGKPDLAFSKVEIPDISSPDDSKPFEFRGYLFPFVSNPPFIFLLATKPSFPPGSGMNGNTGFAGKRDSFGKMFGPSSTSKDQLGTLLEEEEEEEQQQDCTLSIEEHNEASQVAMDTKMARHRPASLNLRPLSLVQGTIVCSASGNLPTPILTPTNTRKPGVTTFDEVHFNGKGYKQSFQVPLRRFSSSFGDNALGSCDLGKKRCSSISYKRSTESALPTPELTPTELRFPAQDSNIQKPLSVADQHFLFRSHHVLLSRITELERTLKHRASQSRPLSFASEASTSSSEPNDEMLQLISDLKAERDELKRDVDGWRQRVADADKQAGMLAKRIEAERREAWVARSRLGLLEVEKSGMAKSLETKTSALSQSMAENAVLMHDRDEMKGEIKKLNARLKDADAAFDECTRLRAALEQERARRKELEKLLDDAGLLNTPKLPHVVNGSCRRPSRISIRPRGLGFQSIDSEGSTTDVESVDDSFTKAESTLDSVAEEAEFSDEDNGLAGYEDEDDSDVSFSSPDGSSIGSADELDTKPCAAVQTSVSSSLPAEPTDVSRASLSKTWTFPRGKTATSIKHNDEIDRFFGCLDDISGSPPRSEEMNQTTFLSASRSMSNDELPPFVIPSDVGVVVESTSVRSLDVVPEEDEADAIAGPEDDELVGEAVEGGIRFTFNTPPIIRVTPPFDPCVTPPPEIRITPPMETYTMKPAARPRAEGSVSTKPISIPAPVEEEDESSLTFVFPPKTDSKPVGRVTSPPRSLPPSRPGGGSASPPSSIPRAVSLRSMSPKAPSITFTPSKNVSGRFTAPLSHSTPPGRMPSSIPQPVTSPKFFSTPTKVQTSDVSSKQSRSGQNGSTFKPHSKLFMSTLNTSTSCVSQPTLPRPPSGAPTPRRR